MKLGVVRSTKNVLRSRRYISMSVAKRENEIRSIFRNIKERITNLPITSLGIVENIQVSPEMDVVIEIDCIVPGYPYENELFSDCISALSSLSWMNTIKINNSKASSSQKMGRDDGLSKVKNVIAVASCKGGVGKSTTAVNLAISLARMNLKVGILDADIFGPSIPSLLPVVDPFVAKCPENPKMVLPISSYGLKMLSFGHVNPKSGAAGAGGMGPAVLRGPVASKVINQLALMTNWGELDYLIIDFPPGTSDIQLSLCQNISLTGSILVTTPHNLSLIDASKGVAMFTELGVPTLAMVENMSYFTCNHGEIYYPFGKGGRENLLKSIYIDQASDIDRIKSTLRDNIEQCPYHEFPLHSDLCTNSIVTLAESADRTLVKKYTNLAKDVIGEIFRQRLQAYLLPSISFDNKHDCLVMRYFTANSAEEYRIPSKELLRRDPQSGDILSDQGKITGSETSNRVVSLEKKGNYGISLIWNQESRHGNDIFSFQALRKIALELEDQKK